MRFVEVISGIIASKGRGWEAEGGCHLRILSVRKKVEREASGVVGGELEAVRRRGATVGVRGKGATVDVERERSHCGRRQGEEQLVERRGRGATGCEERKRSSWVRRKGEEQRWTRTARRAAGGDERARGGGRGRQGSRLLSLMINRHSL